MRWRKGRQSDNIEDRRGAMLARGGGLALLPLVLKLVGRKGGIWIILIGAGIYFLMGGTLSGLMNLMTGAQTLQSSTEQQRPIQQTAVEKELVSFVSVVLADTEDTWQKLFQEINKKYKEPKLVLFRGLAKSACGMGKAAMGPFYCPGDNNIYIDLSFFEDLRKRHKAPGDFAQAYVIAHEVGHHVQTLLGISQKIHRARQQISKVDGNRLSVKLELQADCFAGVWAHHADKARNILERGDIDEALNAATAIGDDRLQKQSRGYVTPDSFTHGSSAQRSKWFRIGIDHGDMKRCNTFATKSL